MAAHDRDGPPPGEVPRAARDRALAALVRRQRGHVAYRQLAELGFGRKWRRIRLDSGALVRVHDDVVRLASTPRTPEGDVWAAILGARRPAWASHRTALALWGLGDGELGGPVHLTVEGRTTRRLEGVVFHQATTLRPADRTSLRGTPITGVDRSIVDGASQLRTDEVEDVVLDALRLRRTTHRRMSCTLDVLPNGPGTAGLRTYLARLDPENVRRLMSWLERRMYLLCERNGLPRPAVNVRLHDEDGGLIGVVDICWPGVVAEVDGLRFHSTRRQKEHDDARQNAIVLRGELVLRYSDGDIRHRPERVVVEIRRAIALAEERRCRRAPDDGNCE